LNKKPESISPIIPEAPPELPTPKVSAPTAPLPTEPVPKIPIEAKKDLKESTTSPTRKQAGTIKSPSNPVLTLRSSRGGTTSSSTARIRAFAYDDEDDKIKSPKSPKLEELFQALEKKDDKKESEHKYKDKSPEDYKHKEEKKQKKEKKEKKDDKEKKEKKENKEKDAKKNLHTSSAIGTLRSKESEVKKGKFNTLTKSSANASRKQLHKKFTVEIPDVPESDSDDDARSPKASKKKSRINLLKTDSFTKANLSPRNTHLVLPSPLTSSRELGKPRKIASYSASLNTDAIHK